MFLIALKFVLLIIGSYLLGNISVARVISKILKKDITKQGSGNPGAMNMIRTFGIKIGLLTLLFDMIKGVLPALCGLFLFDGGTSYMSYIGLYTAGLAVVLGHMYPVFYKFKGGKSVACALGVFMVASPWWLIAVFLTSVIYLYVFDYGAVFSFIVLTLLTISQALTHFGIIPISLLLLAIYTVIMAAHRENIFRLLIGKENKVNLKKSLKKLIKHDIPKQTRKEKKEKELG